MSVGAPTRVLVFGAGATGSLFAARLAAAGHAVTIVGRAAHVQAIRAGGLSVEGLRPGRFQLSAEEQVPGDLTPHAILLSVKTYDLGPAGREVGAALRTPVPLLAAQNGLDVAGELAGGLEAGGWLGAPRFLVRAIHSVPATWLGPGRVRQAGEGEFVLPAQDPDGSSPREVWAGLIGSMGYPLRRAADFEGEVWRKLLVNAAINPVTADHGILNGQLREDPWRGQALALLDEARSVALAEGHPISRDQAEADLWRVVTATAENRSSMLQDLERGRPTEIEAISGAILRAGSRHNVRLPATQRAWDRITWRASAARISPKGS
ncbi:MAG: ketopantoate reductase family protein [Thermoplasmata archaeon]|nr:ketopantoate reductase family protein [Thermoplasmata archaeon]